MPRGAGAARRAGAVKERGKGEDPGGEAPGHGLWGCNYGGRAHISGRGRSKCDLGPRQPTDECPLEGGTDIWH